MEENGNNYKYNGKNLEMQIQNQLLAEQEEHNEIMREKYKLQQTRVENFETNIDDVIDDEMEKRLIEERSQQPRSAKLTHSFYSSDEDPHDIEMEFQRRLQQENERLSRERNFGNYEQDEIEFRRMQNEREKRAEQERKLQLMIDDHERRTNNRNQDRNMERGSNNHSGYNQRKPSTEDEWFALQRKNHMEKRQEQERLRQEQREFEEQERQRKLNDVRNQREQEKKMMNEYQRQKEFRDTKERKQQQNYKSYDAKGKNREEIVKDEFKEKALADYERRRETLDKEIERAEREKHIRSINYSAPQVASKSTQRVTHDDEPPPPRPPPPSSLSPISMSRSPSSSSPQSSTDNRFSFSQQTVANFNSHSNSRQSSTSSSSKLYSPGSQYQPRSGSSSKSPSREDPAQMDFKQKMKMFGATSGNDSRSTYSRKQREYMD